MFRWLVGLAKDRPRLDIVCLLGDDYLFPSLRPDQRLPQWAFELGALGAVLWECFMWLCVLRPGGPLRWVGILSGFMFHQGVRWTTSISFTTMHNMYVLAVPCAWDEAGRLLRALREENRDGEATGLDPLLRGETSAAFGVSPETKQALTTAEVEADATVSHVQELKGHQPLFSTDLFRRLDVGSERLPGPACCDTRWWVAAFSLGFCLLQALTVLGRNGASQYPIASYPAFCAHGAHRRPPEAHWLLSEAQVLACANTSTVLKRGKLLPRRFIEMHGGESKLGSHHDSFWRTLADEVVRTKPIIQPARQGAAEACAAAVRLKVQRFALSKDRMLKEQLSNPPVMIVLVNNGMVHYDSRSKKSPPKKSAPNRTTVAAPPPKNSAFNRTTLHNNGSPQASPKKPPPKKPPPKKPATKLSLRLSDEM